MEQEVCSFEAPNCPHCLIRLVVEGPDTNPYFYCRTCGTVFLGEPTS